MKLLSAILPLCATLSAAQAQTTNPLSITQTSPEQFRLDWIATNEHRFQMEGSLDLLSWVKVGPVVTGIGISQTMLVAKTTPGYFYKLSEGGLRPGFDGVAMSREDDHTYPQPSGPETPVPLGFAVNFFGVIYSSCYVNNNGNISFDSPYGTYTPNPLRNLGEKIIAPFWADVDTRNTASNVTKFTSGGQTAGGRPAFGVTYKDVGYFHEKADKLNRFQVVLIERSDTGANNFDIEFNYDKILWETGDVDGTNGYGGKSARAGVTDGGSFSVEIDGSGVPSAFLDSDRTTGAPNLAKGLIYQSYNSNSPGRFVFPVRGGVVEGAFTVNAGTDQLLSASHSATFQLNGSVSPPTLPGLSYRWIQKDGLPPVTFSDSAILNPTVTISEPGDYQFELTATGTGLATFSVSDSVNISHPAIFEVSAGDGVELTPPASLTLTLHGVATFSGGGAVSVHWMQTSGDAALISNPNILQPGVTLPGPGYYVFEMTATTANSPPFTKSSETFVYYYEE